MKGAYILRILPQDVLSFIYIERQVVFSLVIKIWLTNGIRYHLQDTCSFIRSQCLTMM